MHDRTYTYVVKPPPTSWFLKKASGMSLGSIILGKEKFTNMPGHMFNDSVSLQYIYEVAKIK